ncbi:uncharacterized protein THITE_2111533 [Thermothielavioides terrestris NRRL 8126]|uniref:Thioredoxin domain-containing protein n=1 Tax=Thermothielavioides terrestris (strain ATCC 38088 / NRRL 8126) TaxID=578455 RepID=G2R2R2_THETT|nr:uncharacterized protein THITE_2111533 [Thermothielavioides terrestris NRRL 8126]AEO65023.1 hypothetical protein THITE_2111533 [Thermothielavioides terrestris NRRL 8126]
MQLLSSRLAHAERRLLASKPIIKSKPVINRGQPAARLQFSTSRQAQAPNQVYASVRNPDQFHTYQLLSSSSRTPLLTLWTTSWCSTCRVVAPLVRELVESGVGEAEGGVGYCTVEFDAPDVMAAGLGLTYMINSVPTLLSFDAGEAQVQTKVTDGRQLADRKFLEEWIKNEARRHGNRGGGGPGGGANLLGSLFGKLR